MKKRNYLSVITVICFTLVVITGCSLFAPNTSKAITEKEQLNESKVQTGLMKEQNTQLKRIADVLEKMASQK